MLADCCPNIRRALTVIAITLVALGTWSFTAPSSERINFGGEIDAKLAKLGIQLSTPPAPVANYVRAVTTGHLVFLAGHGPQLPDGSYMTGKVGDDVSLEEAKQSARLAGIALLSSLKAEIGDLDRVKRIVKVNGMVNCTPTFVEQSQVINGCSDFLVEVFGDRGKHARAAVGMVSLPKGFVTEIEMIVEIE